MTTIEKVREHAEMQNAWNRAIEAVENCKDTWSIEYYGDKIREEIQKPIDERDANCIEAWEEKIDKAKEANKRFDVIMEQLFKLMTGATIK